MSLFMESLGLHIWMPRGLQEGETAVVHAAIGPAHHGSNQGRLLTLFTIQRLSRRCHGS